MNRGKSLHRNNLSKRFCWLPRTVKQTSHLDKWPRTKRNAPPTAESETRYKSHKQAEPDTSHTAGKTKYLRSLTSHCVKLSVKSCYSVGLHWSAKITPYHQIPCPLTPTQPPPFVCSVVGWLNKLLWRNKQDWNTILFCLLSHPSEIELLHVRVAIWNETKSKMFTVETYGRQLFRYLIIKDV